MKLNELLALSKPEQQLHVQITKDFPYDGTVGDCPAHMMDYEVTKVRAWGDELNVYAEKPECPGMTWRQLADAIESMPDWAQDTPVDVFIEDSRFIHNDSNHGVREIVTYFSKEPKDVQDDGQDYVSLILDTTMGWRISHR